MAELGSASVGVLGTELVEQRIAAALAGVPDSEITVCFDADAAGQRAAHHLLDEVCDHGVGHARNLVPPDGIDVTEWMLNDPAGFSKQLGDRFTATTTTGPARSALASPSLHL